MTDNAPGPKERGKIAREVPPRLPLASTRQARIDNLALWFDEMRFMDGVDPTEAARKVIDAALPRTTNDLPKSSKVLLAVMLLITLIVTLPAVFWVVGNVIVPWYEMSLSWL